MSNVAKKLLYESISSSNIVLEKYPDSKYVDDAIYYMARSYFTIGEIYKAEKYFNQLINDYSNSQYYNESRLWLEYTYLKLNSIDSSFMRIDIIENDFLNSQKKIDKNLFFLLYNLKGDIFVELKNYDKAFFEFEKSLDFLESKTKKIMLYSKLSIISESAKKFDKAIDYLNKIQILSNDKDVKIESFRKWLDIMKKMNFYDEIIIEIEKKLLSPDFDTNNLKDELNVELAIAYMKKNKFSESKNIFNNIIENSNQKIIKSQSYYWLGYISLFHEFEIDLAIEYFNLVTETMRSSKYSKEVRNYTKDIDSYKSLLDEYNFLLSDQDNEIIIEEKENEYIVSNNISNTVVDKDSLLFIIAEKLFFDFNQKELSIDKHNELIEIYPNSIYVTRSKKIIDQLTYGFKSSESSIDSLVIIRDLALDKLDVSLSSDLESLNEIIDIFKNLATSYSDFYSYYILGFIYENYLYDPSLSIKYYLESLRLCNDDNFKNTIKNKILLIESDLDSQVSILNKNLNYIKAQQFILNDFDLDSAAIYLNSNYENSSLKNEIEIISKDFHEFIIFYKNNLDNFKSNYSNDSLLTDDTALSDSTLFHLAMASSVIFKNDILAKQIIKTISDSSIYQPVLDYFMIRNNDTSIRIDSLHQYLAFYDSTDYFSFKNEDSILYINQLTNSETLLNLFQDTILHIDLIDTLEIKNEDYQNKMPNINNDIVPGFNKK